MELLYFNRARIAVAKAVDLDEVKNIRDKAEALRVYARQAKESADMERQCAIIRLRAERRIGELLAKTVQPGNFKLSPRVTIRLSELGITRNQSSRWQTAATLPAADFERYVPPAGNPPQRVCSNWSKSTSDGNRDRGAAETS
jgi:hypothetical protein